MCTTVALETALRSCIRKIEGVHCVAIAVDASSFFPSGEPLPCVHESAATRLQMAVQNGKVAIVLSDFGTPISPLTCDTNPSAESLLHQIILRGEEPGVAILSVHTVATGAPCPEGCDDANVGLLTRFLGSIRYLEEEGTATLKIAAKDEGSGTPLDCDDTTPLETLLMAAFVRDGDLWALRIIQE